MADKNLRFLVVDDFSTMRRIIRNLLKELGFNNVEEAEDGADALNKLRASSFDFVVSDWNMPNMDGYRLTQRIRQLEMTLPVIGVTANALAEEKQRCLESGMDSCLSKPVTLDILKHTLATYAAQVRKARKTS